MKKIHAIFLFLITSICILAAWSVLDVPLKIDFVIFIIGMVGLAASTSCLIAFSID